MKVTAAAVRFFQTDINHCPPGYIVTNRHVDDEDGCGGGKERENHGMAVSLLVFPSLVEREKDQEAAPL